MLRSPPTTLGAILNDRPTNIVRGLPQKFKLPFMGFVGDLHLLLVGRAGTQDHQRFLRASFSSARLMIGNWQRSLVHEHFNGKPELLKWADRLCAALDVEVAALLDE